MNLIILGPQGSGKGTQAKLLSEKYGIAHISSGDLLRAKARDGTEKGRLIGKILEQGELVPFQTITEVLEPALLAAKNGFILDGTPRDERQAYYLNAFFEKNNIKIDKIILLNIPKDESVSRLMRRAEIEHRTDDNLDSIKERLNIFEKETLPVIENYRSQGKLLVIDGTPDIQTIYKDLVNKLDNLK